MNDSYDAKKQQENLLKHNISFDDVALFEWKTAVTNPDMRFEYGEVRLRSYGFIGNRLYCLVWTSRNGAVRPISFRKANKRERGNYEKDRSAQTAN